MWKARESADPQGQPPAPASPHPHGGVLGSSQGRARPRQSGRPWGQGHMEEKLSPSCGGGGTRARVRRESRIPGDQGSPTLLLTSYLPSAPFLPVLPLPLPRPSWRPTWRPTRKQCLPDSSHPFLSHPDRASVRAGRVFV